MVFLVGRSVELAVTYERRQYNFVKRVLARQEWLNTCKRTEHVHTYLFSERRNTRGSPMREK